MSFPAFIITLTCMSVAYGMTPDNFFFHLNEMGSDKLCLQVALTSQILGTGNFYSLVIHTPRYRTRGLAWKNWL